VSGTIGTLRAMMKRPVRIGGWLTVLTAGGLLMGCGDDGPPVQSLVPDIGAVADVLAADSGSIDTGGKIIDIGSIHDDAGPPADTPKPPTDQGPAPDPDVTTPPDTGNPPDPLGWTLAVLPDTQYYARDYPWVFDAQTEWLAANHEELGIAFVVHEGDITQDNVDWQWANARQSIDHLVAGGVPFALVPGNHDYGPSGDASIRESQLDLYFGPEDYAANPSVLYYEGESLANTAHLFEAGGRKMLVLAVEFAPRDDVVAWADEIAEAHPDHTMILLTHVYLYFNDTRYNFDSYGVSQKWNPYGYGMGANGGINDGEQLWQKLVRKHAGFALTLNGHVLGDGVGQLTSLGQQGNVVHQLLANYQQGVSFAQPEGGGGFLRLMRFEPDGKTITVTTYSPYLDEWLTDSSNDFVLSLDPTDYDYLQGASQYPVVQIEDDPLNSTLVNCDGGSIKSPGADIDATLLYDADGVLVADLSGCSLLATGSCDNTEKDASAGHGAPDADGTEAGGGYVSLNGGRLNCGWSDDALVEKDAGQVIEVHEIGQAVENYRLRLCVNPAQSESCTTVSSFGTGIQLVPVDLVFF
jgi:hypothetical protein